MKRSSSTLSAAAVLLVGAVTAHAYPNGTPHYVTDLVPACASCHSIRDPATMPEAGEGAAKELAEQKHLGAIRAGAAPLYAELDDRQKQSLAAAVEALDQEATVTLQAPASAPPGAEVEVTVSYTGGNGPVVGIMLVDQPLRFQARPAQAQGWYIREAGARTSVGKDAGEWFARRLDRAKDLNFLLLPAPRPAGGPAPSGTVTFRLSAPHRPGSYSLAAVFLYGTENTDRAGFFQRPSGRILFSKPAAVQVK